MGLNLGEAHAGWAPKSDVRYLDLGVFLLIFHLVMVIAAALIASTDPGAFLTHPLVVATLTLYFFLFLVVGYADFRRHADGEQTTFVRSFRVADPHLVYERVGKHLPRKFYPLNRFLEDSPYVYGHDDETVRKVTLVLRELGGVKNRVELVVKYDRHLVEAKVITSDRDSMVTRDLLDALSEFFERHRMDWLSVDVDEDATLLMGMGMKDRKNPDWPSSFTKDAMENLLLTMLVVMGLLWFPLMWAIMHPVSGWVMNVALMGILFRPLVIVIFVLALAEYSIRSEQDVESEHVRTFHASPWYVSAAIQEGLDKARWSYKTRTRVDPTDLVRSECFDLEDRAFTIDVVWADKDTDPNWTTVRIRSPRRVDNFQSVQDLVRRSVFRRYKELGL